MLRVRVLHDAHLKVFFFEIPVDLLISVIAYLINFAHRKISRTTDRMNRLNEWLALNVRVVYNADRIVPELA